MTIDPLTVPFHVSPYYVDRQNPLAAYAHTNDPVIMSKGIDVCPHCKCELTIQKRCREHGEVIPMLSAVVNPSIYNQSTNPLKI
jgi:hypothetical protein